MVNRSSGESVEELSEEFDRFRRALSEPVLDHVAPEPRLVEPREGDA